jgi:hypothetical protein
MMNDKRQRDWPHVIIPKKRHHNSLWINLMKNPVNRGKAAGSVCVILLTKHCIRNLGF